MATTTNNNQDHSRIIKYCLYFLAIGALGFLAGYYFSQMQRDSGEKIFRISKQKKSTIVPIIGNQGKLFAVSPTTGKSIDDCSEKSCRSKLVFDEYNKPILLDRKTNEPIPNAKILNIVQFAFDGSYCEGYSLNGRQKERCCDPKDIFC